MHSWGSTKHKSAIMPHVPVLPRVPVQRTQNSPPAAALPLLQLFPMRKPWKHFFFFCHEFYSHKLNLQKSNICGAKPYSLFLCMETEAQEKQDWTSSKCSCPIPCKRRSIYVLRWSCCQVLLKLATCFFLQTISLPPLPHLVCLSPISYIVLLIDVLGYCHYINSTKNVHNYKCLCMCIYLHACNALVWIAVVFPVRVKLSWPRTCCCSVWGGKQQLQGWVMKVLVDG